MTENPHEKKDEKESLEDNVSHILEEARMVLPGIQALLGFQLVAVFNQSFSSLPVIDKQLHAAAIFLSVNAICFLLTPAALHRESSPEKITKEFAKRSSRLVWLGLAPLLLSIVLDSYVVFKQALDSAIISAALALILLTELTFCWFVWPLKSRTKTKASTPDC